MDYKTIRNIPKIFDISATAIFKGRNALIIQKMPVLFSDLIVNSYL